MKPTLQRIDLTSLDEDWSSEEIAVVEAVRRVVKEQVLPSVKKHSRTDSFPLEAVESLKSLSLLEPAIEEGLDPVLYGLALREIEAASSSVRSFFSVQGSLVLSAIKFFGTEEQKSTWIPPLAKMEKIGCFGLTEPGYGSNPSGMQARAQASGDSFEISGQKMWITNGTRADVAIVWAKLDDKVRGFLVPTDQPGLVAKSIDHKWSFRASDTGELYLDKARGELLPESKSVGSALKCLNEARYGIVWGVIGAARACLEEAVDYLLERPQFNGKPLASHQLIQSKLAWAATEITSMQLMAKRLGELKRQKRLEPHQVSMGKMHNCRKAIEIARTCRELLGAAGIVDEHEVGRHLVDLETVLTYEGTENIHALVLGQHLTGIPAYS